MTMLTANGKQHYLLSGGIIGFICASPNHEIGETFLFKGHKIGTCSYFGADSATKRCTRRNPRQSRYMFL
jgi:hypothetical protein